MADTSETIRMRLELETKAAEAAMKNAVNTIKEEANKTKKSFSEIGEALKTAFVGTIPEWEKYKIAVDKAVASLQQAENSIERQIMATKTEVAMMENLAAAAQKVTLTKLGESTLAANAQRQGVSTGDAEMLRQMNVSANQAAAKELANRAIIQDNLNQADAKALALQEQLVGGLSARAVAESNVALAQKNIVASNLAETDAQMLKQLNALVPQINASASAEEKRALASRKVAEAEQYQTQTNASGKIALATQKIADAERGLIDTTIPLTDAQKKLGAELKAQETQVKKTGGAFSSMINVVKGAITAMLTLAALRAVTQFFTGAIKAAQDFRAQLLLLNFSEAILSQKGMDITRAELDKFVSDVETKFKYLSKLQAMTIVSETAGATQEFGISKEQLGQLTQAIAFIQLKNKMLGREDVDAAHIINAAMDARSNFFNGMGINITKSIVEQKAYNMGLAKWGEELSKDARFQAILALLVEQTSSKQAELNKQLEGTPLGNQMKFSKEWADTMLIAGNSMLTVKDNLLELWASINENGDAANAIITWFQNVADEANIFIDALENASETIKMFNGVVGDDKENEKKGKSFWGWLIHLPVEANLAIVQILATILAMITAWIATVVMEIKKFGLMQAWSDAGANARQAWIDGWNRTKAVFLGEQGLFEPNPTPVPEKKKYKEQQYHGGGSPAAPAIDEEAQKMKEALDKLNEDILQAEIKLKQDMQDVAIDLGRKMVDITLEYETKRAELAIDYANKIADIERDYARKIEDINIAQQESQEQARVDALQREREFQEKMLQLKEEFLMDLDDALHSRDARQILKLIKRYNLDKKQAEREHELEEQAAAESERIKQESYERQRQAAQEARDRALEDAAIDNQRKLDELARQEQAEVEAAVLAANRKLADLEKENLDRNILLAAGLANDFATTATWLGMIDQLFTDHYGYVTGVYQAMMAMLSQPITIGGVNQPPPSPIGPPTNGDDWYNDTPTMAEGGTIFANRPTRVVFGEHGAEMASFTPINRQGKDTNKLFSARGNHFGGGGGRNPLGGEGGGKIGIELVLPKDFEAKIINSTLGKTAEVIARVRRSK